MYFSDIANERNGKGKKSDSTNVSPDLLADTSGGLDSLH